MKINIYIFQILIVLIMIGCIQPNNSDSETTTKISDYTKSTENFTIDTGLVQFDNSPRNLTTHILDSGANRVIVYERTGVTMIDVNDWEAKYTETLIFQLDTTIDKFEYCDSNLKQIDCRYYWVCLSKTIKKEIRVIDNGCIKGYFYKDSILIDININPEFRFGGAMDKDKNSVIKFKTTRR